MFYYIMFMGFCSFLLNCVFFNCWKLNDFKNVFFVSVFLILLKLF